MEALRTEILNPKTIQIIKDQQDLELIRLSENNASIAEQYL